MEKFFKLALFSLIGLILATFALGLIQDNQGYNYTPYGYGYGPGMTGPGKHMGGEFNLRYPGGPQGNIEFKYDASYGK
ncbi:MAG: hypothetical protein M0Z31_11450 [Clostridia bacterium]|nr:hypothetical protein [Clostridia bacterium]